MSRVFWVAVGAVGGVVAYRKGTQAVARARELGPLGTAQVAAQATSTLASRTAHGLGRLKDLQARREGRLVIGSAEEVPPGPSPVERPVPGDWVAAPSHPADHASHRGASRSTPRTSRPRAHGTSGAQAPAPSARTADAPRSAGATPTADAPPSAGATRTPTATRDEA